MQPFDRSLYPFTPRSLEIDGHSLSYLDEGKGPVVVMLHGNPTWSFYYRNLVLLLRDRYRVIVPDHMGCGFSDKPQAYPYTLQQHISNLSRLLDHLGIGSLSLVVHDWGGAIGMGYAGRHPDKIEALVVTNTAAFMSKKIPLRINICKLPGLGALFIRGLNAFAAGATVMAVAKKISPEVARAYVAPYDCWADRIATLRFVEDIPMSENHVSWKTLLAVERSLAELTEKPMLIVWGGRDFCFTRHFYDEWCARFPAAETMFLPEAGHYVLEDEFKQAGPKIAQFLDANTPPPSEI